MKKKYVCLVIALFIVFLVSGIIYFQNHKDEEFIACLGSVMCSAQQFQNSEKDGAWLKITLDDENHTKKILAIKDEKVIKKMYENPLEKVIGVNLKASIPTEALEGKSDYYIKDTIQLLIDCDDYDKYFEISDVSFGDAPYIVKTYYTTPENEITERIKNGELCYFSSFSGRFSRAYSQH